MNVSEYYEHALAERGYQPDEAQKNDRPPAALLRRMGQVQGDALERAEEAAEPAGRAARRLSVGRGGAWQSFLMDAFYATVPVVRKTRLHFHEFMRGVHRELEEVRACRIRWTKWPGAWPSAIA